jgi:hypothetical protein
MEAATYARERGARQAAEGTERRRSARLTAKDRIKRLMPHCSSTTPLASWNVRQAENEATAPSTRLAQCASLCFTLWSHANYDLTIFRLAPDYQCPNDNLTKLYMVNATRNVLASYGYKVYSLHSAEHSFTITARYPSRQLLLSNPIPAFLSHLTRSLWQNTKCPCSIWLQICRGQLTLRP